MSIDFSTAALALVSASIGFASKAINDWLADGRAAKRAREARADERSERQADFQRATLLAVQEAAVPITVLTGKVYWENRRWQAEEGVKPDTQEYIDWQQQIFSNIEEIRKLGVRVQDEQVRALVTSFVTDCLSGIAFRMDGSDFADRHYERGMSLSTRLNERIGQILRGFY